jgi:hypothetical protein
MTDLRTDDLAPRTPGEWIDALIVRNIRMWHLQEKVYEMDSLNRSSREDLIRFFKEATWMNLQRTEAMDGLDFQLAQAVLGEGFALPVATGAGLDPDFRRVWERS